jgi:predicted lipid-binding transport protein (Tim44 family)
VSPAKPAAASPPAQPEGGAKAEAGKKAKTPKGKKSKGADSKSDKDAPDASGAPSVAAHPRAARSVARAKGWGGLAGFLIAGYLSLPTGTLAGAALRALVAGSVCYVAAWAGAVFVWRRLVVIEIKNREQQLLSAVHVAEGPGESLAASTERPKARAA